MKNIEYYDYNGYPTKDIDRCCAAYIPVVSREDTVNMMVKFIRDLEEAGGCTAGLEVDDSAFGWWNFSRGFWQRLSIIDIDRLNMAIKNHNQKKEG